MDDQAVATPPAQNELDSGAGGWEAAVQPAAAAPSPAQTPDATPNAGPNAPTAQPANGTSPAPAAPAAAPPVVLTPARTGIMGVVDKITDALAGTNRPEIAHDQDGNAYVKNTSLTRGQQWMRIASEAITGAAKGFAAGKGAGNTGAAAAAGVDAGAGVVAQENKQNTDVTAEARQQNLDAANHQLLTQKVAINALTLRNLKFQGDEASIKASEAHSDWLEGHNGVLLGYAHNAKELANMMIDNPGFHEDHIQKSLLQPNTIYNPDGTVAGIAVYRMLPGSNDQVVPAGTDLPSYDPATHTVKTVKTSDPMKQGDYLSRYNAAFTQRDAANVQAATMAHTQAQTAAENATAAATTERAANETKELPSKIAKNQAEASKDYAAAAADRDKAAKGIVDQSDVDAIGTGHITLDRMGYLLSHNPKLLDAVTAKYPDFDTSKAMAYPAVYKEFTSTKPGTAGYALNAGATALIHLQDLKKLNTIKSHIPGTADYQAYQTQLNALAPELAKFYGDSTVSGIESYRKTLGSQVNRDAAISTQAKALGVKFDSFDQQWNNAAPSGSYEAPLPGVSEKAKEARASLDPDYRQREVVNRGGPGPVTIQPGEQIYSNPQTKQQVVLRNGKYVDVKTGQAVQQ